MNSFIEKKVQVEDEKHFEKKVKEIFVAIKKSSPKIRFPQNNEEILIQELYLTCLVIWYHIRLNICQNRTKFL